MSNKKHQTYTKYKSKTLYAVYKVWIYTQHIKPVCFITLGRYKSSWNCTSFNRFRHRFVKTKTQNLYKNTRPRPCTQRTRSWIHTSGKTSLDDVSRCIQNTRQLDRITQIWLKSCQSKNFIKTKSVNENTATRLHGVRL